MSVTTVYGILNNNKKKIKKEKIIQLNFLSKMFQTRHLKVGKQKQAHRCSSFGSNRMKMVIAELYAVDFVGRAPDS